MLIRCLQSFTSRFRRDQDGAAAVEFAIILPVMLLFYLGTMEVTQLLSADAKVAATSDTVGNLVTRLKTIDDTSMGNIFGIASAVMNPYDLDPLKMTVTAVRVDDKGKGTVHWSRSRGGTPMAQGAGYIIPGDLQAERDTYFVVSSATYAYRPLIGYGGIVGDVTLQKTAVFRPRKSTEVTPR